MADYPLPKFHFQVDWSGTKLGFTEVSGLDAETEVIEYRDGASKEYHSTKQPGRQKWSNITMKRGSFESDNEYFDWWKNTKLFEERAGELRRDVTVSLLNEEHEPIVVWKVKKAWPTKVQPTDLKSDASEVAIESIELAHEGVEIEFK